MGAVLVHRAEIEQFVGPWSLLPEYVEFHDPSCGADPDALFVAQVGRYALVMRGGGFEWAVPLIRQFERVEVVE